MSAPFVKAGQNMDLFWSKMLNAMEEYDTRPIFITAFKSALSICLPKPLFGMDEYKKFLMDHPLPSDPGELMDMTDYQSWITFLSENIMRRHGLLGLVNDTGEQLGAVEDFMKEIPPKEVI